MSFCILRIAFRLFPSGVLFMFSNCFFYCIFIKKLNITFLLSVDFIYLNSKGSSLQQHNKQKNKTIKNQTKYQ